MQRNHYSKFDFLLSRIFCRCFAIIFLLCATQASFGMLKRPRLTPTEDLQLLTRIKEVGQLINQQNTLKEFIFDGEIVRLFHPMLFANAMKYKHPTGESDVRVMSTELETKADDFFRYSTRVGGLTKKNIQFSELATLAFKTEQERNIRLGCMATVIIMYQHTAEQIKKSKQVTSTLEDTLIRQVNDFCQSIRSMDLSFLEGRNSIRCLVTEELKNRQTLGSQAPWILLPVEAHFNKLSESPFFPMRFGADDDSTELPRELDWVVRTIGTQAEARIKNLPASRIQWSNALMRSCQDQLKRLLASTRPGCSVPELTSEIETLCPINVQFRNFNTQDALTPFIQWPSLLKCQSDMPEGLSTLGYVELCVSWHLSDDPNKSTADVILQQVCGHEGDEMIAAENAEALFLLTGLDLCQFRKNNAAATKVDQHLASTKANYADLSTIPNMNKRPALRDIQRFFTAACGSWKDIGYALELNRCVINLIERDSFFRQRECLRKVIDKWLDQDPDASWGKLVKAWRSAELYTEADYIIEKVSSL